LVNDGSLVVSNRLNIVKNNAILGFILVIGVLALFLNFRSSFWIAMSIPAAFAVSLIVIPWFGVDINAITLAAMILVLGMLVDDSIVVSENIFSFRKTQPPFDAALNGTMEVFKPVVATVITTMLAFAPMLVMEGIMGRFVYVIPITILAALLGSVFDCFCILPNHLYHSSANFAASEQGWRGKLFANISIPYRKALRGVLRWRYPVVFLAIGLLVFTIYWAKSRVGFDLFPTTGAQVFYIYIELDDDKTFSATEEVVKKVEQAIQKIPEGEVEYYYGKIGTDNSDSLAQPVGGEENHAYLQVTLVPYSERSRGIEEIMEELRGQVGEISGAKSVRFEIEKSGPPTGKPVEFHIHSDSDEDRAHFVSMMVDELKSMKGVTDIDTTQKKGRDEYKLNLDYDKLAVAHLTVNDVASTMRVAFDGIDTTSIIRDNEEVKIRVRFPAHSREKIQDILNLKIRNPEGKLIPLWSFATLGTIQADTAIHHTDGDVTTTITAQTQKGVTANQVIDHLTEKISPLLKDYPSVNFSYGGEAEKTTESMRSLFIAFGGGAIAIYLILTLLFNSLSQPLLILAGVPFGLIGVTWAFYFHGIPFSFLSLIGVVGLSGVVINASLIMVDFTNKLVGEKFPDGFSHTKDLYRPVIDGALRRLRPIIISTITTVAGLLPTAYGIGGSDPFISPMVLAVAYGLIFGTLLTLFLIPCLFLINKDFILTYFRLKVKIFPRGSYG